MLELLLLLALAVLIAVLLYYPFGTTESKVVVTVNTPVEKFQNPNEKFKLKIFVADFCGACKNYKNNKHDQVVKDLKDQLGEDKITIELIDDYKNKELMNQYQIEWFPTFIGEYENNLAKLPMNADPNSNNILDMLIGLIK